MIWVKRESESFSRQDWTTQITLIRFDKFAVARKALKAKIPDAFELTASASRHAHADQKRDSQGC